MLPPTLPHVRRGPVAALILALLSLPISACLQFESSTCPSGLVCPQGMQCAARQDICIPNSPTCGDGVIQDGEACDDGNLLSRDGCASDCKSNETCGNNFLDPDEACDDGNNVDGDKCSADCKHSADCGNGVIDEFEECDDGNDKDDDDCLNACKVARCGDGFADTQGFDHKELCDPTGKPDDNSRNGPVNCDPDCTPRECGDGFVNFTAGEECEPDSTPPGFLCTQNCKLSRCGNGITEPTELCDDGPHINGSTSCAYGQATCMICNATCSAREQYSGPFCGDGTTNLPFEECDYGRACGTCNSQCENIETAQAVGTIQVLPATYSNQIEDGDVFIISDGLSRPIIFVFCANCHIPTCTTQYDQPSCYIPFVENTSDLVSAIKNTVQLAHSANYWQASLHISAQANGNTVTLTHDSPGISGNQRIYTNIDPQALRVIGMSGGAGYDCPKDSPCRGKGDCAPGLECDTSEWKCVPSE